MTAQPITGRGELDLSFLLTHASYVLSTRMTAAFAEIGIAPREYCVLAHAMTGSYTQIELAKLSDLDKTTMLNTMDYLERAGYAERTPSPADRRARITWRNCAGPSASSGWTSGRARGSPTPTATTRTRPAGRAATG